MIVKDEAPIIERCLASVSPVIDRYVICDTGSTDDTVDLVTSFFNRHGVPGTVHQIEFGHFEAARNEALARCRDAAASFDYILLTDADMELRQAGEGWLRGLDQPAYAIRQTNGLSYYNTRLLRRDVAARYVGVTHEYLSVEAPVTRLEDVWFIDHACGSSRSSKLQRDLRLLRAGLQDEPDNTRYMFYLAQTLKDAGRFAEAIDWYTRRIETGGWEEESWYARFMRAQCHLQLGEHAAFIEGCLEAYSHRPTRAEPLHALARHFREKGRHEACFLMCEAGERIHYPVDDELFISDSVYTTGFLEEVGISGYYCASSARREKGREACLAVATSSLVDANARTAARRNALFYSPTAAEMFGHCELTELRIELDAPYRITNPSLWSHGNRTYGVVRAVNYMLDGSSYTVLDPKAVVRTRNWFVTFDDSYQISEAREIRDRTTTPPRYPVSVRGFEDCRLFRWQGKWWCSASVCDANPARHVELAVLTLNDELEITRVHVNRAVHPEQPQKNWVPLVDDEGLRFVYTTDPTVIVQFDPDTGVFEEVQRQPCWPALDHLRGGSQAIPFEDGWLYLVHEAIDGVASTRVYLHRFVYLDDTLSVAAITEPFVFLHKGVEFAAGLIHDEARGQLVASFGASDARAYVACLDASAVAAELTSVAASS